jgi:DNA-binding response OmpR family regulator
VRRLAGRDGLSQRQTICAVKEKPEYILRSRVTPSRLQGKVDRNLTILIAEDDEDYAFILASAIKANGWKNPIRIVGNGKEVIDYLTGEGKFEDREAFPFPSVMFLDVKMPGASGFDVLRWVRKHPECSVLPTMMLSSSDDEKDIQLAYELGANGYFVKPMEVKDLKAMLQAVYEFWAWSAKPRMKSAGYGHR